MNMLNQSENINELAAALSKVQGQMKGAEKNSVNPFHKNRYADLSSVWDAIRISMAAHGLCLMQYGDAIDGRGLTLVTMLCHASGQWIKSFLPLKPAKDDSQGIGAAMTYMRRYALCALLGVVADEDPDDDGETACGRGKNQKDQKKPINGVNVGKETIATQKESAPPFNMEDCISQQQLESFMEEYKKTDEDFKTNFLKWVRANWLVHEFFQMKKINFPAAMESVKRNLEKNKNLNGEK